jgi:hypothetical protein
VWWLVRRRGECGHRGDAAYKDARGARRWETLEIRNLLLLLLQLVRICTIGSRVAGKIYRKFSTSIKSYAY